MELTKEIFYDKDLVQNNNVTLKYSGELFKNNSEEVYIVYGYDKEWKNTTHQKMKKQEDCFSTSIQIQEFNEFNFCFRNSLNIWDNNNTSDYHLPISQTENIEFNAELNKLLDQILNEVKTPSKIKKQNNSDIEQTISYFENLFDELFNTSQNVAQLTSNINQEKDISYYERLFDELFNVSQEIITSNENVVQRTSAIEQEKNISYYEKLFDELFSSTKTSQELNSNLDLVDTFPDEFEPIIKASNTENIEPREEIQDHRIVNKTLALTKTSKRKSIFEFENLSPLYVLGKRLRLAFYKLIYVLPSFLFGEEEDSEN